MSFSRLSTAATYTAAMMESSTKMAFTAIDCADFEVAEQQLPSSPFINGVMPQPSKGRWCVADEETPACDYDDLAAPARRCQRGATCFSPERGMEDDSELAYQATTVEMLRMQTTSAADEVRPTRCLWRAEPPATWAWEHLFQKALTPSDVGKLNRLVVPKHHAEKHLLMSCNPMVAAGIGMLIDFVDDSGKTWRFRCSFSATSRMYIVTKGWRRFVREKGLRAGDTVAFSRSAFGAYKRMHIDYCKTQKKPEGAVMLFGVDIARV